MQENSEGRPDFHYDFPTDRKLPRYGIIRTPPGRKTPYLILSERLLVMPTHWLRKRTVPCPAPKTCPDCVFGTELRWKGYLAVCTPSTGLIEILELTDRGGVSVKEAEERIGSLRGYKITVWREGPRENSPVAALVARTLDPSIHVPECPDVREFLYRMWYVKEEKQELPLFEIPTIRSGGNLNDVSADPSAHAGNGHLKKKQRSN